MPPPHQELRGTAELQDLPENTDRNRQPGGTSSKTHWCLLRNWERSANNDTVLAAFASQMISIFLIPMKLERDPEELPADKPLIAAF